MSNFFYFSYSFLISFVGSLPFRLTFWIVFCLPIPEMVLFDYIIFSLAFCISLDIHSFCILGVGLGWVGYGLGYAESGRPAGSLIGVAVCTIISVHVLNLCILFLYR